MNTPLSIDELRVLQSAFDAAVDHHSDSPRTYDIAALANTAAPAAGAGFLRSIMDNQAVAAAIQALIQAAIAKLTATKPAVVAAPPPVVVLPPAPATPTVAVNVPLAIYPTALTVDLDLFLAEGVPCPYRVEEFPDHYEVIKTDGTSNLPIHGGAYLHAGYIGQDGKSITFDPGSPLDHTAKWTARRVGTGRGEVFCGPGNPAKEGGSREVANFRLAEYERTRGMDVPVHFPPSANETVVEIVLSVETPAGVVTSKPVRFPKVS